MHNQICIQNVFQLYPSRIQHGLILSPSIIWLSLNLSLAPKELFAALHSVHALLHPLHSIPRLLSTSTDEKWPIVVQRSSWKATISLSNMHKVNITSSMFTNQFCQVLA